MIRILTTLYNSEKYIGYTIQSLKLQNNKNWKCYITCDLPTDNSIQMAIENIDNDPRFELIVNKEKMWQIGNYWNVINNYKEIDDNDICITVDGDDWVPDENTLNRVEDYYKNPDVWITYGQFVYYDGTPERKMGFARPPQMGIRNQRNPLNPYTTTHLRTWKAWLFRKIEKKDIMFDDVSRGFINRAGDLCFMWPMLEMAGDKHSKFTPDINYVYNIETNLNDFKVSMSECNECENIMKNRKPYNELKDL